MSFLGAIFGGAFRALRKVNRQKKPICLPRKPSKAEAMKLWGARVQPGKGGYVPRNKR